MASATSSTPGSRASSPIESVDRSDRICNSIGVYRIRFAKDVEKDLKNIPAYHRRRVLEAIKTQLVNEPTRPTRKRKLLVNLIPPWTAEPPIWQLSVGDFRVFYDVADEETTVNVRAIRRKPPGKTTEEIL